MINLLPYTEKKFIKRIRFLRVVNTVFAGIIGLFWVVALLLLPTLLTITNRFRLINAQMETLVRDEKIVSDVDSAALEKAAQVVEQKLIQTPKTTPLVYVDTITESAPRGVLITKVSLNTTTVVDVFGTSPNRESLQAFIASLEAQPSVERVDNPLSNLVKTKEGTFKITVGFKVPS